MKPRVPILVDMHKNSHLVNKLNILYGVHCIDFGDILGETKKLIGREEIKLIESFSDIIN